MIKNLIIISLVLSVLLGIFYTNLHAQALSEDIFEGEDPIELITKPKTLWDREALHFLYGGVIGYGFYYSMIKKVEKKEWYHYAVLATSVAATGYVIYKEIVLDPRENTEDPYLFVKTSDKGNYNWGNWGVMDSQTKGVIDLCFYGTGGFVGSIVPYVFDLKKERDVLRKSLLEGYEDLQPVEVIEDSLALNSIFLYPKYYKLIWEEQ